MARIFHKQRRRAQGKKGKRRSKAQLSARLLLRQATKRRKEAADLKAKAALEAEAYLEAKADLKTQADLKAEAYLRAKADLKAEAYLEAKADLKTEAYLEAKADLKEESEAATSSRSHSHYPSRCPSISSPPQATTRSSIVPIASSKADVISSARCRLTQKSKGFYRRKKSKGCYRRNKSRKSISALTRKLRAVEGDMKVKMYKGEDPTSKVCASKKDARKELQDNPDAARKLLENLAARHGVLQYGSCRLLNMGPKKTDNGYARLNFKSIGSFASLQEVVIWSSGVVISQADISGSKYHHSHLCNNPLCIECHVVKESPRRNNRRKGCRVLFPCSQCDKYIHICKHKPSCISSIVTKFASWDEFMVNGICRNENCHEKDSAILQAAAKELLARSQGPAEIHDANVILQFLKEWR